MISKYRVGRFLSGGVTLMELLVAVSIFAIGIVALIRSFLGSVSALESLNNRFAALQYLEDRTSDAELELLSEGGLSWEEKEEAIDLRVRRAVFKTTISPVGDGSLGEALNKVSLSVIWQENRISKDESLVFLAPGKK